MCKPPLTSPASQTIGFGWDEFSLEGEGRWSVQYRSGKNVLVLSKLLDDAFDWSWLESNQPEDLPEDERYPAAIAIYVAGERYEIPPNWRDFAVELCGPGAQPPLI